MRRTAKRTILLVGEGDSEGSVGRHYSGLYVTRGCGTSVKIRNAYGKSPEHIVRVATKIEGNFDHKAVWLDTDVRWDDKATSLARKHRIQMIGSEPCLEGMILRILGEPVPHTAQGCKTAIGRFFPKGLGDSRALHTFLTRDALERARQGIASLDQLLTLFEGR